MAPSIPETMKAIYVTAPGSAPLATVPVPEIADHEILVQVKAVAINPTDHKHADRTGPKGTTIGCDFSGIVVQVGSKAAGRWQVGERAAGMLHGGCFEGEGAFAEYLKVAGNIAWKVPQGVSDLVAATYGISPTTAALAYYSRLGIPWPSERQAVSSAGEEPSIFIYGGSTAVGIAAIQLAKLSGYRAITVASPRNFDLVKQYGADDVFDYHDESAPKAIAQKYPTIAKALDCISEGGSVEFTAQVIQGNKGKVSLLLPFSKTEIGDAKIENLLVYTVFNKAFQILPPNGPSFPASPEDNDFMEKYCNVVPGLIEEGKFKAPPLQELSGGLEGLFEGMDLLRKGKVSGTKLVSQIA